MEFFKLRLPSKQLPELCAEQPVCLSEHLLGGQLSQGLPTEWILLWIFDGILDPTRIPDPESIPDHVFDHVTHSICEVILLRRRILFLLMARTLPWYVTTPYCTVQYIKMLVSKVTNCVFVFQVHRVPLSTIVPTLIHAAMAVVPKCLPPSIRNQNIALVCIYILTNLKTKTKTKYYPGPR
jgi:hypothetical protein